MTDKQSTEKQLTLVQEAPIPFLEGPSDAPFMHRVEDVRSILEECFFHRVTAVLLYSPNLTQRFFDLSSGEAGEILQKLFQYGIRLAIVSLPGAPQPSKRFGEFMAEEASRRRVALCDSAHAARAWIEDI